MLWYKSWLETRWRFAIGLVVLILSVAGTVLSYPSVVRLMPLVPDADVSGAVGRQVKEAVELARSYRGYIWSQSLRQNLPQMLTLFAVLLGTGGLLSQASRGGALYTLSLPASRDRVLGVRAATALAELLALAFIPTLLFPVLSPAVGQTFGIGDAVVHGLCLFLASAVFFSLAFLLSTVFSDVWGPALIACGMAAVLAICGAVFPALTQYGLIGVMTGERYFRGSGVPWLGLLGSAVLSMMLLYGATRNIARQDF